MLFFLAIIIIVAIKSINYIFILLKSQKITQYNM